MSKAGGSTRKAAMKDDGTDSELSDMYSEIDLEMESIPMASITQDARESAEAVQPAQLAAEDSDDDEYRRADGNTFVPS
jgi:hypothetical protein